MDFVLSAFSTFLGAGVALGVARLAGMRDADLREEAALNNLILDLASKRAFKVTSDWDWAPGELVRVTRSVEHARTLIRDARLVVGSRSSALSPLRDLTIACNRYLESSERDGDERLKGALITLSQDVTSAVTRLQQTNPARLLADVPGGSSL